MRAEKSLFYLRTGVERLLERGTFQNEQEFRPSQKLALEAYLAHLSREDLPPEEQLKGFFVLPTGTGKTPLFIAITTEAQEVAREHGDNLRVATVVPTTKVMHQTKAQVEAWGTPVGKADIGIHGDGHRQIGHDFNIYTYDAWVDLTRKGKLGSHNVDILISDEAHRGTSEVRIEEIFSQYENNGTACLAFTATYAFDEDKSVERTHKHKIIECKIKQCIENGELAAYVAVQFYVIRVMPPMEYPDGVEPADYNRMLMRKALMQRMVAVARDGVDEVTQEPLFDDQMGFYCQDTKMANQLAEMLNADEIMLERIQSIGGKGVAVPIHSNIRPKKMNVDGEMVRTTDYLLEQMETGFFAGFTGDSQLKEGYDYSHLKVIFDGARGSLVDKAQIIGRAARRLENDMKDGELEGMTFVDFITYIGDPNPEIDAQNKEMAMRKAVTALDVLGGSLVLGPGVERTPPTREGELGGTGLPIVIDGQEVEAFTTLEESKIFAAQLQKLHEGEFIEITLEMIAKLEAEQARTGKKAFAITNAYPELETLGISAKKIYIIESGRGNWTQEQWDLLMKCYRDQPTVNQDMEIEITAEMIAELEAEQQRTGKLYHAISIICPELKVVGVTRSKIQDICVGKGNWTQAQWDLLMECYRKQPQKFEITSEMLRDLKDQQVRTGKKATAIITACPELTDLGITANKINIVDVGAKSEWTQAQWDLLMECYRKQPTITQEPEIELTAEKVGLLEFEQARTGKKANAIIAAYPELEAAGITVIKIYYASRGKGKWTQTQWDLLIECYRRQPDKGQQIKIQDLDALEQTLDEAQGGPEIEDGLEGDEVERD